LDKTGERDGLNALQAGSSSAAKASDCKARPSIFRCKNHDDLHWQSNVDNVPRGRGESRDGEELRFVDGQSILREQMAKAGVWPDCALAIATYNEAAIEGRKLKIGS